MFRPAPGLPDGLDVNPRLTETLTDFPFARLNTLIAPITPPAHLSMINLSVGEPQGAMPAFARQIVADEIDGWNRTHPTRAFPISTSPSSNGSAGATGCPGPARPGAARDPDRGQQGRRLHHRHGGDAAAEGGGKPIVALPNPFYQAYLGGAVLSGAEPLLVNANAETGFLPDLEHR